MPCTGAAHESKGTEERFANDSPRRGLRLRRYKKCQRDSQPRSRVTGSIRGNISALVIGLVEETRERFSPPDRNSLVEHCRKAC